jgi:hypothetical protein
LTASGLLDAWPFVCETLAGLDRGGVSRSLFGSTLVSSSGSGERLFFFCSSCSVSDVSESLESEPDSLELESDDNRTLNEFKLLADQKRRREEILKKDVPDVKVSPPTDNVFSTILGEPSISVSKAPILGLPEEDDEEQKRKRNEAREAAKRSRQKAVPIFDLNDAGDLMSEFEETVNGFR